MSCDNKLTFTISQGIGKVIEAFDKGKVDSLIPKIGKATVDILKKWWHMGRMTCVRITGDIWSPCGEESILVRVGKANIKGSSPTIEKNAEIIFGVFSKR